MSSRGRKERERENSSILALKEEKNSCKNISQLCLLTGGNRPSFFPAKEHSKEGEESAETTVVMAFLSRSPPSVVGSHSQFSLKEHFMARRSSTSSEGAARSSNPARSCCMRSCHVPVAADLRISRFVRVGLHRKPICRRAAATLCKLRVRDQSPP